MRYQQSVAKLRRKFNQPCENTRGNNRERQFESRKSSGDITITLRDNAKPDSKEQNVTPPFDTRNIHPWEKNIRETQDKKKRKSPFKFFETTWPNHGNYTYRKHKSTYHGKNTHSTLYTIASEKSIQLTCSEVGDMHDEDITNKPHHYCGGQSTETTRPLSQEAQIQEAKLKNLCGELLVELCKVTAGRRRHELTTPEKNLSAISSSSIDHSTSLENDSYNRQEFACYSYTKERPCSIFQSPPTLGNYTKGRISAVKTKHSKTIAFRPLVCTKLSIPWRHRRPTCSQAKKNSVPPPRVETQNLDSIGTVSTSTQVDSFLSRPENELPTSQDKAVCVRARRRYIKIARPRPAKQGVQCKNRSQSNKNSKNTPNGDKTLTKVCRNQKNQNRKTRFNHGLHRPDQTTKNLIDFLKTSSNNKTTRHFIKNFNPSSSTDSKTKTETDIVSKPRLKKNTFTLPSSNSVSCNQKSGGKSRKTALINKDEVIIEGVSKELSIIDSHVKAHSSKRTENSSTQIFNNCFKRMLSTELKTRQQNDVKCRAADQTSKSEKSKKDGLFSCLIPRGCNKTSVGK